MKKNVKLMIFLSIFRAIFMKVRIFAMSKDLRQVAREPRPQMMNGHESQKGNDNI